MAKILKSIPISECKVGEIYMDIPFSSTRTTYLKCINKTPDFGFEPVGGPNPYITREEDKLIHFSMPSLVYPLEFYIPTKKTLKSLGLGKKEKEIISKSTVL